MTNIPVNFSKTESEYNCYCGKKETMEHIYDCEILRNGTENKLEYRKIYEGSISEQIEIFRTFERNMKNRKILCEKQNPCGLIVDPLTEISAMGNK